MVIKLGEQILNQGYETEGLLTIGELEQTVDVDLKIMSEDTIRFNTHLYLTKKGINKKNLYLSENPGCISTLLRKERQFLPLTWEPSENDFGRRK